MRSLFTRAVAVGRERTSNLRTRAASLWYCTQWPDATHIHIPSPLFPDRTGLMLHSDAPAHFYLQPSFERITRTSRRPRAPARGANVEKVLERKALRWASLWRPAACLPWIGEVENPSRSVHL